MVTPKKIYCKMAKKSLFQVPIWVPEKSFLGFGGLVCIEKWFYNFDAGTRSAISGTPKSDWLPFCVFLNIFTSFSS